jgi:demethylmenaquinone methyltransferase/2-methoxy-6-polyprenyl-1,4-benzoquinol methylase
MSIEHTLVNYYAARAAEYDRIYSKPERQGDLSVLRRLVESRLAGAHVLEVACGTGYWTEILARAAASVVATDINEEVLALARARLGETQNTTIHQADAYAPPLARRPFTAGLAAFWWSHVPKSKLSGFLRGLHRVLSRGARVVFIDNAYVEGSSTPISRADESGNTYQTRRLEDGSTHEVLKNFPTAAELRAAVEPFATDVRVESLRYYWMLSYVARAEDGL